ncbi:sugar kinase [Alpinimonas psychrophila]|uniref:2-dehydro-3-deoxygluconokinase n=1 Tax=Alpinimonas psychrophila TaxID=748908 RepID=A0A7W3JTP7_9MICO|nr:2-dehydro-3-deoxygluconokinase [Alpinimonas psychrophila]
MRTFEVLCIGETMVMVTPISGGHLDGDSQYILRPGGAESNVALILAALGHDVAWAGYLGADPFGAIICSELRAASVDISAVIRTSDFPTGVYFKDPHPEGTSVYYYRAGSAASTMGPGSFSELHGTTPRAIHLSGITAAISVSCRELLNEFIFNRVLGEALVSFDVNHRPALWGDRDPAFELLELAQASDVVFVGLDEASALWGVSSAEEVREVIDKPSTLVVKDGGIEAVSFSPDEVARVPAKRVKILDPVGAGDAFAAGWLSGMLRGSNAVERLSLGHLAASRVLASTTDAPQRSDSDVFSANLLGDRFQQGRAIRHTRDW